MRPIQTSRLAIPFPAIYQMRPYKRPVLLFHSPLFTKSPLQTSRLAIPFPAIFPMRPSKRPV